MKISTLSTRDLLALYQAVDRTLRCELAANSTTPPGPFASDWHWYTAQIEAELDERGVDYELAGAEASPAPGWLRTDSDLGESSARLAGRRPPLPFDAPDDWSACEPNMHVCLPFWSLAAPGPLS